MIHDFMKLLISVDLLEQPSHKKFRQEAATAPLPESQLLTMNAYGAGTGGNRVPTDPDPLESLCGGATDLIR